MENQAVFIKIVLPISIAINVILLGVMYSSNNQKPIQTEQVSYTKVNINDKALEGSSSAILFKGQTFIPIKPSSELLGFKQESDTVKQTTNLLTIASSNPAIVNNSSDSTKDKILDKSKDISTLKLYSKISDTYLQIDDLSNRVMSLSDVFEDAMDNIDENESNKQLEEIAKPTYTSIVKKYSSVSDFVNALLPVAAKEKIDITDMKSSMDKLKASLDGYNSALNNVISFSISKSETDSDKYEDNEKKAFDIATDVSKPVTAKYKEFLSRIQNY